jgi:drug/metabolite transporter (DMT)-like permease
MDGRAFAIVLAAALMHAAWNALVKVGGDRFVAMTLMSGTAGIAAAIVLPFVPWPAAPAWPWLLLSVALHTAYSLVLIESYRTGDLAQVYPIARGSAPLLVAAATVLFLPAEEVSVGGYAGIVVLGLGVVLMSIKGGRRAIPLDMRGVGFALATAVTIAAYTVVDGVGARAAGSPHGYVLWLFVLWGLVFVSALLARRGRASYSAMRSQWRAGTAGGMMQLAAYWIVIWAMTVAPIALVAALRETSVLFAAVIGVVLLREPLTVTRLVAGAIIVVGTVLMRLAS